MKVKLRNEKTTKNRLKTVSIGYRLSKW
jgi:hypothetical protein